jgi:hypothetical protein
MGFISFPQFAYWPDGPDYQGFGTSRLTLRLFLDLGTVSFGRRLFAIRLFRKTAFRLKSPYLPNLPPMAAVLSFVHVFLQAYYNLYQNEVHEKRKCSQTFWEVKRMTVKITIRTSLI